MNYNVLDIETTGLDKSINEITEIGVMKIGEGKVVDTFETLVSVEGDIPVEITVLTGISKIMLKGKPCVEDVLLDLKEFLGDEPVIAHNASFDWGFITEKGSDYDIEFDNKVYDTLEMSRDLLPHLRSHKLCSIADYLKIDSTDYHRAINDVLILSKIFEVFLKAIKIRGVDIDKYLIKE